MIPFLVFFNGQIFILAAAFTMSVSHGEEYFASDD